jgi:hypothetical protein
VFRTSSIELIPDAVKPCTCEEWYNLSSSAPQSNRP